MGFKTAAVFVTTAEPLYISTNPEHDPQKANQLVKELELGSFHQGRGMISYGEYFYPPQGEFALGAYEDGFVLVDQRLHGQITREAHQLRDKILANFPESHILAIELHSGNNLFGYAVYENAKLIRALGGSMDGGSSIDFGPLQPEEEPHFAKSKEVDGQLVFFTEIMGRETPFDLPAYGESLVFAMTHRFLGSHSDRWSSPGDELMLQQFQR